MVGLLLSACASVPLKTVRESNMSKQFDKPSKGHSGLYIYRNSSLGMIYKKDIFVNGECVGETAPDVFFYKEVAGGRKHVISTESEFSPNDLVVQAKEGKNYFIRQYITLGLFVAGSNLELVGEQRGMKDVSVLELAESGMCSQ